MGGEGHATIRFPMLDQGGGSGGGFRARAARTLLLSLSAILEHSRRLQALLPILVYGNLEKPTLLVILRTVLYVEPSWRRGEGK
jgi:hypothetical protein